MLPIQITPMLTTVIDDPDVMNILTIAISCICGGLSLIYGIIMAFLLPAALGRLAATGIMGSAFKFGEVFGMVRKAIVPYLIVLLGIFVAGIIAPLGLIACIIGVYLTMTYYYAISGHLYGQAYRQAVPV